MVSQRGQVDGVAGSAPLLEGPGDPLVEADPTSDAQVVVQDRPHEGMDERVFRHSDLTEDARRQPFAHLVQQVVTGESGHRLDQAEPKLLTEDGPGR
jgi:hypothetical protein